MNTSMTKIKRYKKGKCAEGIDRTKAKTVLDMFPDPDRHIGKVFKTANNLTKAFYPTHSNTYLDFQDFIAECVLSWLQGRSMERSLIDSFRRAAPLSRRQWKKAVPLPSYCPIESIADSLGDPTLGTVDMDTRVLVKQICGMIEEMDPVSQNVMKKWFALNGGQALTLKQIGQLYGRNQQWAYRQKEKVLKILRKRLDVH